MNESSSGTCRTLTKEELETKLYIFKPHDDWRYMGGVVIASATNFEEAVEIGRSIEGMEDDLFLDKEGKLRPGEREYNTWQLADEFVIKKEEPRLVLHSYNSG